VRFEIDPPTLLPAQLVRIPSRGEFFIRYFRHSDAHAPVVMLLHGWTASSDLNFFTAYDELKSFATVIGVDHRGHGRGLRPDVRFSLEDCADDAAALCRALGVDSAIAVGYSMGGPIAMLMAQRHPGLVSGLVLQATALEWSGTARERTRFKVSRLIGPITRRLIRPSTIRFIFSRHIHKRHPLRCHLGWMMSEWRRNDPLHMAEAGRAISRFDARPWVGGLGVPIAVVVTTKDRLVPPHKQHALATAANAHVVTLEGDHFVNVDAPTQFSAATSRAVRLVSDSRLRGQAAH
jgi:pimeloyl-ACP methyl ester carboxylesterase